MYHKHKKTHRKYSILLLAVLSLTTCALLIPDTSKAQLVQLKRDALLSFWQNAEFFSYYPPINSVRTTLNAQTIPVLLYHGISTNSTNAYTTTKENFRQHMGALYSNGYRTISSSEFISFLKGDIQLPNKSFLLTFDDGRKDSYYNGDPILKHLGFSAVMFTAAAQSVTNTNLFSDYYLNKYELKKMEESGRWEIESHAMQRTGGLIPVDNKNTLQYFLSNKKWLTDQNRLETDAEYESRIKDELKISKASIEKLLEKKVTLFSYPFSDMGQESTNNAKIAMPIISKHVSENYTAAFQQQHGYNRGFIGNYPTDPWTQLRRIEPNSSWTSTELINFLQAGQDIQSPKEAKLDVTNMHTRWKNTWGNTPKFFPDSILLHADPQKPSSFIFLDGSRAWSRYTYSLDTVLNARNIISLFANLSEPGSGTRCVWRSEEVLIETVSGGKTKRIRVLKHKSTPTLHTLAITSNGFYIGCLEDGRVVAEAILDTLAVGGIGVELWSLEHASESTISNITVQFNPPAAHLLPDTAR